MYGHLNRRYRTMATGFPFLVWVGLAAVGIWFMVGHRFSWPEEIRRGSFTRNWAGGPAEFSSEVDWTRLSPQTQLILCFVVALSIGLFLKYRQTTAHALGSGGDEVLAARRVWQFQSAADHPGCANEVEKGVVGAGPSSNGKTAEPSCAPLGPAVRSVARHV
jgi:hypothetical protein